MVIQKLDLALFLCLFGFVSPPVHLVYSIFSSLEVTEGVRFGGHSGRMESLRCISRNVYFLYSGSYFDTHLKVSGSLALSLDLGRASKKRMRKEYSVHHLNLVKILTLQAFPCVSSLCTSLVEEAVTQQ